jgi:multidrug efflux pump subunit AcrA (membrane-fusion protein)
MKRIVTIGIPLAIFLSLMGWRIQGKRIEAADQAKGRDMRMNAPAVVTLATARRRDIVQTYDSIGNVESLLNVRISAKVAGRIDYLEVREGDKVARGHVLVRLDPSELQAQVAQQHANVAQARFRLSQARLNEGPTNVGVSAQIIQQSAGVSTAVANLNQARSNSAALIASADASVRDAQGKVDAATAAVNQQEANVRSAQANLENAQTKYNRVYGLYKEGYTAAQDVDDARTTISVQKGALDVANRQRDSAAAQK